MGYCGLNIAGHSGTQFKNKKAFSSRKIYVEIDKINAYDDCREDKKEPTKYQYKEYKLTKYILFTMLLVGSLSIVVSVFGLFFS